MNRAALAAVAGLGVTQIVSWGSTYYLLTVMARPIAAELGMADEVVAFGQSLMLVLGGVLGPFIGRIMDMHGARPVMSSGSALASFGLVLLSFADGAVSFFLAWAVLGASGAMILYPAAFTALTQIDAANARRNITFLTLPGGLASTVFWPLGVFLLETLPWRQVCLAYAGLNLLLCLPLHLLVTKSIGGSGAGQKSAGPAIEALLPLHAQRRAFVLFATMLALNSLVVVGVLNQVLAVLERLGHPSGTAMTIAMLFGISQVSARIAEMLLGQRHDAGAVGLAAGGLLVASFTFLAFSAATPWLGYAFAIALGASNGLITIVRGALVLSLFGSRGYGERVGSVAVAQSFASAAAPVIFAFVLARLGTSAALALCIVGGLGSLIAMAMLFRHARSFRTAAE